MRAWKVSMLVITAGCYWGQALATEIGVASFNLAWAGTSNDFQRHLQVCSSPDVSWCNTRVKDAEKAEQCQEAFDKAAGGASPALLVAPCNAYKLNTQKAIGGTDLYNYKLDGLNSTINGLITNQHIDIIAFQEVKSNEVLKTILGVHTSEFDTCVANHTSFQTVGFAWRKSISSTPGSCSIEGNLAVKEDPHPPASIRTVRPGLTLQLTVDGLPLSLLNVHLKSSCANLLPDGKYAPHLLTDNDPACKVLNRQVVPLENWIEKVSKASPIFVVLGDFNRKIDEEEKQKIPTNQVRQDGSDPASQNKTGSFGEVNSKYLWQEISDGNPTLIQIPLAQTDTGCTGFKGLDHILHSEQLFKKQPGNISSFKTPVSSKPNQIIETSDHCPRITHLNI